ncbi:MAG: cytochrome c peroxidase [Bacteroidales bacterium]
MKKILLSVGTLLVIGSMVFAYQRYTNAKELDRFAANEQIKHILTSNRCLDCHSQSPELPFYASFPIAEGIIQEDIQKGYKYIDIESIIEVINDGNTPSEVDLAKLEQSIINQSMPPAKFTALHWHSSLDEKEREIMLNWIKENRSKIYSNGLSSVAFSNEAIQPLIDSLAVNPAKVALGEKLYHDTRLSKDNNLSCASCHSLDSAGIDRLQFSKGIYDQIGGINAPTVFNAALHIAQFWDGRAADLQAQAGGPPFDMLEMGSESWDEIIEKLAKDPYLTAEFKAVYPEGYSGDNITDAIAEFEKTLLTPNSRFDLYLKGDATALTSEEVEGYELFKSNNCATCHVGQAMGGQSYEYMGIVADYFADREMKADREIIKIKDQGHFNATNNEKDLRRFKTPSLRNVALTAPYLHDGTAATLEDATRVMLKYQVGKNISDNDINKIVLFMNTLNGQYNGTTLK